MKIDNDIVGCLSPIEGSILSYLATKCDSENTIVNIGCYKGRSVKYIVDGVKSKFVQSAYKKVFAIDIKIKDELINDIDIKHEVNFIEGSSVDVAKDIPNNIELLFIDGDHSYTGCTKDLELYWAKVIPSGIMVVHDVFDTSGKQCEPEVTKAFNEFVKKHNHEFVPDNWNLGPIHRVDSCAIVQKLS